MISKKNKIVVEPFNNLSATCVIEFYTVIRNIIYINIYYGLMASHQNYQTLVATGVEQLVDGNR